MKPPPPSEEDTCPLWMMTFGDCMSLLVTFFVMLIAFSNVEEFKLLDLMGALKGGLRAVPAEDINPGGASRGDPIVTTVGASSRAIRLSVKELSGISPQTETQVKRYARQSFSAGERFLMLSLLEEGFSLVVHAAEVFEPGTARMTEQAKDVWRAFADLTVASSDSEIRIVAVVPDDTPVYSERFRTAWGLATERALAVEDSLLRECEVRPDRFSLGAAVQAKRERTGDLPAERMELTLVGYYPDVEETTDAVIVREL